MIKFNRNILYCKFTISFPVYIANSDLIETFCIVNQKREIEVNIDFTI